jgi:aspartyl-tRNA(Asn)/glutamyl-tRNA(Gln) amidotransferase subunit C
MPPVEIDVKYVAHLARLELTPAEQTQMTGQLRTVLQYVEKLNEVNIEGVEPTAHAFPLVNVTRPDEPVPSLPHEEAMRNAPAQANGLFIVPKIVE